MPEGGPVVANSGPLIALATVTQLDLLGKLYTTVLVPDAVFVEVAGAGPGKPGAVELPNATWLRRVSLAGAPDPLLSQGLGPGETEAIALALTSGARLLLLDDRRARRIAEVAYGLRVQGVAGLLVTARRRGLVPAVRPLLAAMRSRGYFLSPRLVERACREVGET